MRKLTAILVALTVLTICSCGGEFVPAYRDNDMAYPAYLARSVAEQDHYSYPSSPPIEQVADRVETTERKIVKRGNIKFATADVNETKSLITQTVRELNGYISDDNADSYSHRIEHKLTIRVPADNFDLLVNAISQSVNKFDSKKIEALDVTEEYIDIAARTKTKKELQNRYIALLERAETVEDILRIKREIGDLQTEIESVEGRMRYLIDRIAFSTLAITYYQEAEMDTAASSFGFASKFLDGIKNGWEGFLWFIIGLSHLWVFILIAMMIYFVWQWRRKRKAT